MATVVSLQVQMASVMELLAKTALAEMSKLFDDASAALRWEISRCQIENEALKSKLLVMEGELSAAQGSGERTSDSSLNIAFEVKVCDEIRKEQNLAQVAGKESCVAGPTKDELCIPVEKKRAVLDALEIKYEPVDRHRDWSESVLLSEDWLEEETKMSQSQEAQMLIVHTNCDTSAAAMAAANSVEGLLCKEEEEEELHMQPCPVGDLEKGLQAEQEQEGEPLTPGHLLPGSVGVLGVQFAWSKSTRSGKFQEMLRHLRGGRSNDRFSPSHVRASCSEKNEGPMSHLEQKQNGCPRGPPDGILAELAFPLGSGSAQCEASFDAVVEATSLQGIEGRGEFVCTCCGKMFPCALELQTHEEQQGTGKRFSGLECSKAFAHSSVLKKHLRIHSRKKLFTCSGCEKTFTQHHALQAHQCGNKPYSYDKCGRSFSHLHNLKIHQRMHTGEKPHSCVECGRSFSHLHNLKIHQRVHTGEKPHSCDECGKTFAHFSALERHQRVHTGEKPHSCEECGKSFARLHNLKTHQRVHTGEKPHSCEKCRKSFARLYNLKIHQRVHMGENLRSCDENGKRFHQPSNLKTHLMVHNGEKPYSCDECGKSFYQPSHLKTHLMVHTGEKPHSCEECGKSFSQLVNLKSHQRVHTGEKPYGCTLCGKSYSQNNGLQKHMRTHSS